MLLDVSAMTEQPINLAGQSQFVRALQPQWEVPRDKPVHSCKITASAETKVFLRVFKYIVETMLYSINGLTSALKATSLKCDVTPYITVTDNELIELNAKACDALTEYEPYHCDIAVADDAFNDTTLDVHESNEEYVVQEVLNRRFNDKEGRFEYQVKWQGYSHIFNTCELDSNIPSNMLHKFEKQGLSGQKSAPERGLRSRSNRETTFQSDEIY
uniref:Chromo domain-containing protein n=1 Tax=Amphimedon queenslandica TaxID=400682 RepID=A0A1X7V3F6_AMPQE